MPDAKASLLCLVGGDEILLDDSVRLVRNAAIAGIDATLSITAGMQHVLPIWAGAFPEADAASRLIGNWVRTRREKWRLWKWHSDLPFDMFA